MAAEIGIVKTLTGIATATSTNGSQHNLLVGDHVFADETITTSAAGTMEIEFSDGNIVSFGPNSQAKLTNKYSDLQAVTGQEVEDSVTALQQALLEGKDPTQIGEATTAGVNSLSQGNEGLTAVDVGYIAPVASITSGFETSGISRQSLSETRVFEDTLTIPEVEDTLLSDQSGNTSTVADENVARTNETAIGAPTVTITEDGNDNGVLNNTEIAGDTDISIGLPDGAVENDILNITIDGVTTQVTLTAEMITAGEYITSITPPAEGVQLSVSATLSDQAGNTSASASDTVTRADETATGAPTVTISEDTNNDGVLNNAEISGDTDISIGLPDGAVENDILNVTIDGVTTQVTLTANMISAGTYTTSVTTPAEGVQLNVSASITDQSGNTSASASDTVTRADETATGAPTVTISEDTNNDGILNNAEISGDTDISIGLPDGAVENDILNVTIDGVTTQVTLTANMISAGTYTTSVTTPAEGVQLNVSASITDQSGNTSASASDTVTRADETVTGAPTVTISEDTNNDGILNNAEISGDTDISIGLPDGAVENDILNITIDGVTTQVTLTANMITAGTYTTSVITPAEGVQLNVSASITDQSENTSASASDSVIRAEGTASTPLLTISVGESNSIVPDSQGLIQTIYKVGQEGDLLDSSTLEQLTEPSSSSIIKAGEIVIQPYRDGNNGVDNIASNTIEATTGLVYLEANTSVSFSGYADDSLHIELGGKVLISTTGNMWGNYDTSTTQTSIQGVGTITTAGNFVAEESGYYTLKMFVYNHAGPGDMSINVVIGNSTSIPLNTSGLTLYPNIEAVDAANGHHSNFKDVDFEDITSNIIDTEGGFYPETYAYQLNIDASLTDTDGSETLSDISLTGLPTGANIANGDFAPGSIELISDHKLTEIEINGIEGSVTATESNGGDTATTTETARIEFDGFDATGETADLLIEGDTTSNAIIGGSGDDIIFGGKGADTLTGGSGSDEFVWNKADISSSDSVIDFNAAEGDVLNLADLLSDGSHTIEGLAVADGNGGGEHLQLSISDSSTGNVVQAIDLTNISVADTTAAANTLDSLLQAGSITDGL